MEESKLYTTQEIEKLKHKIEAYRDTLTSLKTGTSFEDYLYIQNEFEGLKTQMALLEGQTEALDHKQNSQIKGYEDQIQLLTTQIESLNQTIEEMNQEILNVLNKLLTLEKTEAPTMQTNVNSPNMIPNLLQRKTTITQSTDQSVITSNQPSYKLLQSLAGKATNTQLNGNNNIPSASQHEQLTRKTEERHFNQQYFQSINTHPSQIYNGLYRNTTVEPTFHFKNATDAQEIPVNIYDPSSIEPTIPNEPINNPVNSSSINYVTGNIEITKVQNESVIEPNEIIYELNDSIDYHIVKPPMYSEQMDESAARTSNSNTLETKLEETPVAVNTNQLIADEMINQLEVKEDDETGQKKLKNSLFFNFFRKWS